MLETSIHGLTMLYFSCQHKSWTYDLSQQQHERDP